MEDIKLKHLKTQLRANNIMFKIYDTGEQFCPRIYDFEKYADCYIVSIWADGNKIYLSLQEEI